MKRALRITTPTERQLVMQRDFDAPAGLVWKALTKPELIRRWVYFPSDWRMARCDEGQQVGSGFRWEWVGPDGATVMVMHGVYREFTPPHASSGSARLVRTETMEFGGCSAESLVTIELRERATGDGAVTELTLSTLFASRADRDAAVSQGMEQGVAESYDKLEEIITADRAAA